MLLQRVAKHQRIAHKLLHPPDVAFLVRNLRLLVGAATPVVMIGRPKYSHIGVSFNFNGYPHLTSSWQHTQELDLQLLLAAWATGGDSAFVNTELKTLFACLRLRGRNENEHPTLGVADSVLTPTECQKATSVRAVPWRT